MDLPPGSTLSDCNRLWQVEVTIRFETNGLLPTHIILAKSTPLTEVNETSGRKLPGIKKMPAPKLAVRSTEPVPGQLDAVQASSRRRRPGPA